MGYKTYVCAASRRCGACQWLDVPYPIQLSRKQKMTEDLLGTFCTVEPVMGMAEPLHFRNKVIMPFSPGPKGSIQYGMYQEHSHRIVPIKDCLVTDVRAERILASIHALMPSFKITPYDEDSRRGFLRNVLIRSSIATGEIMVTLVCAGKMFPSQKTFVRVLRERRPEISTIVMNINERDTNVVLGTQERVLFGRGWIEDIICGCSFKVSSQSFFQTNPTQTEVLYRTAIDYAQLTQADTVIDAYCGIGTIGIIAAKQAGRVIGVEENAQAVRDAQANAKRNAADNCEFLAMDATRFMQDCAREGERADIVFMDPPRAGSTEQFLGALVHLAPRRVVYVSCNPQTQQRDIAFLVTRGYRVERIQPVDMFPHTPHVETVALLSRVD